MSKKDKFPFTQMDFQLGIGGIIPATQEAFIFNKEFSRNIRKEESSAISDFRKAINKEINKQLEKAPQFPSGKEFFVFIFQYFITGKDYESRDVDNMSKTILDLLKGKFYKDDGQVKTLLVGKKMERRVPKNFIYIAIKEIRDERDIDALKISGLERSVTLFNDLKNRGLC